MIARWRRRLLGLAIWTCVVLYVPTVVLRPREVTPVAQHSPWPPLRPPTIALLHWNIKMPVWDAGRWQHVAGYLRSTDADVVGFNELWASEGEFAERVRSVGFAFACYLRSSDGRFNIGLAAKQPVEVTVRRTAGFAHGLLCAKVAEIIVCETHLTPSSKHGRRAEADLVVAEGSSFNSTPVVLLGDLNALSPLDEDAHRREGLAEKIKASPDKRIRSKFITGGGGLDYGVVERFLQAGWVDVHAQGGSPSPTVPGRPASTHSPVYDLMNEMPMRIDFALVKGLPRRWRAAGAVATCGEVLHGDCGEEGIDLFDVSDHLPVRVILAPGPPRPTPANPGATRRLSGEDWEDSVARAAQRADAWADACRLGRGGGEWHAPFTEGGKAHCRELSKLELAVRFASGAPHAARCEGNRCPLFESCAVVGSSGVLRSRPQGEHVDRHQAIFRLNAAPTRGFERVVGSRTTVRLVNLPQSQKWRRAPGPVLSQASVGLIMDNPRAFGDVVDDLANITMLHSGTVIAKLNRRFRKECVLPFFSEEELGSHRKQTGTNFTPSFGFEAVAHAYFACASRVSVFGFYVDEEDLKTSPKSSQHRLRVPYHYWEEVTVDRAAADPTRPWTFRSHNFELEAKRLRDLAASCVISLNL